MNRKVRITFLVLFIVTVLSMILIGAYAVWTPPPGVVDESVLKLITRFIVLAFFTEIPFIFEVARSFRFEKGDMTVEVHGHKDQQPTDNETH